MLVAQAPCESGYPGTLLVASGYRSNAQIQFIYEISVQKDTLSGDLNIRSYSNASNDRILISDALLKDAPKFIVKVYINCSTIPHQQSAPAYFAFVKRPSAIPACFVWGLQKI